MGLFSTLNKRSGVILITVLWVTMILSVAAVSLGKGANMELSLAKYAVKKLKAKYISFAGVSYALDQIARDTVDEETGKFDSLRYCGIVKENASSLEEKFEDVDVGEGYFKISYQHSDEETAGATVLGFQDEERKININGINRQNVNILIALIELSGFEKEVAKEVAYAVVDWTDTDESSSDQQYGAEDDFYMSLDRPYHCKNLSFDSIEEILLVKGMSKEIYDKIKDNITIYPKGGALKINFDTAPIIVLRAITQAMVSGAQAFDVADAEALVEKIIDYRNGEDRISLTSDDRTIDINQMPLNANEKILFLMGNQFRIKHSDHFMIIAEGFEKSGEVKSKVAAIVDRNDLDILFWKTM